MPGRGLTFSEYDEGENQTQSLNDTDIDENQILDDISQIQNH